MSAARGHDERARRRTGLVGLVGDPRRHRVRRGAVAGTENVQPELVAPGDATVAGTHWALAPQVPLVCSHVGCPRTAAPGRRPRRPRCRRSWCRTRRPRRRARCAAGRGRERHGRVRGVDRRGAALGVPERDPVVAEVRHRDVAVGRVDGHAARQVELSGAAIRWHPKVTSRAPASSWTSTRLLIATPVVAGVSAIQSRRDWPVPVTSSPPGLLTCPAPVPLAATVPSRAPVVELALHPVVLGVGHQDASPLVSTATPSGLLLAAVPVIGKFASTAPVEVDVQDPVVVGVGDPEATGAVECGLVRPAQRSGPSRLDLPLEGPAGVEDVDPVVLAVGDDDLTGRRDDDAAREDQRAVLRTVAAPLVTYCRSR